ncbi:MAG: glycosyltransferase [bacterium]
MKKLKVVITGGHHNSALVVARALEAKGHTVYWFGHRHASHLDSHDSAEYLEVKASGFPFYDLPAGKLGSPLTLRDMLNFPLGFIRAAQLLSRLRPDSILSFGGYLGFSTCLVGTCYRLPIFLHEQTIVPGKSNRFISSLARRIYLTWESSLKYYPASKSLVTGLPLRESFKAPNKEQYFSRPLPTLLVLGGKQGSHAINSLIFSHLPEILSHYNLIHQTGTSSYTGDYDKALALKEALPPDLSSSYLPHGYIGEKEIARMLLSSDLYIGRSGAHITYELAVLGKKAILIPFLFTHGKEQLAHARLLEKEIGAIILPQSELSYPRLIREVKHLSDLASPPPLKLPLTATDSLVTDLMENL